MPHWWANYKYADQPGFGNSGTGGALVVEADTKEQAELEARLRLNPNCLESVRAEPDLRDPPVKPSEVFPRRQSL